MKFLNIVVLLTLLLHIEARPALDSRARHGVFTMKINKDVLRGENLHFPSSTKNDHSYQHFSNTILKNTDHPLKGHDLKTISENNNRLLLKHSFHKVDYTKVIKDFSLPKNLFVEHHTKQQKTYSKEHHSKTSKSLQHRRKSTKNSGKQAKRKFVGAMSSLFRNLKKGFTCHLCIYAFEFLQRLSEQNISQSLIASEVVKVCDIFHIEDKRVCDGIVHEMEYEVLTVLSKLALNASQICGHILGPSCSKSHNPFRHWNVSIPKKSKTPVKPCKTQSSYKPLQVLQLADIHLDLLYKNASNAECGEPLCCRQDDGTVKGTPAGYWGDYRHCDTPLWTLENLLQHLSTQKFDYIMWMGDLPAHNIWDQKKADQVKLLNMLADMFRKYFPKTPVFSALGNHEGVPVDSFAPSTELAENMSWLYSVLAHNWSKWLPKSTLANVKRGAFYDVLVKPGFRIISLNMNYCNTLNFWLLLNLVDPDQELKWLIQTLLKAEKNAEKVHILGHIPPNQCFEAWSWNYYRIVNRFHDTIAAQFFGHTHRDQFLVFYDDVTFKQPISVAYVAPSVTTYPAENPAYRVYQIEADYASSCKSVIDHETYILNLTEANRSGQAKWELEYSAKETYGLKDLSALEWNRAASEMQKNTTRVQHYYRYYYKSHPPHAVCDAKCRAGLICEILEARSFDDSLCVNITAGHRQYMHMLTKNLNTC